MHCPKCGQQQASEEMRFCSRCGFALSIVTELITSGGTLPERDPHPTATSISGRKRGKRLGLLLMLTGIVLAMISGIIHDTVAHDPQNAPGLLGILILFLPAIIVGVAGFVRFLYAWLLEVDVRSAGSPMLPGDRMKSALNDAAYVALPASQGVAVGSFGSKRGDTTEMVNSPSVTENTTKLLDH